MEKELAQLELVKGRIEKPSYAGASHGPALDTTVEDELLFGPSKDKKQ